MWITGEGFERVVRWWETASESSRQQVHALLTDLANGVSGGWYHEWDWSAPQRATYYGRDGLWVLVEFYWDGQQDRFHVHGLGEDLPSGEDAFELP